VYLRDTSRPAKVAPVFPALDNLARLTPQTLWAVIAALAVVVLILAAAVLPQVRRRRQAERAVREAKGQLQAITATMREGVIAYDLQYQLAFANPAFERLTGYPLEDIRDQQFLQYIHPDDRPALVAEWERLAQGGTLRDQE